MNAFIDSWKRFRINNSGSSPCAQCGEYHINNNHKGSPLAVVTCIDPRVVVGRMATPGDISAHQTLGGIVPTSQRRAALAMAAYLEYVIKELAVRDLAVIGHRDCKMVKFLLQARNRLDHLKFVRAWSDLAGDTRQAAAKKLSHLFGQARADAAEELHTLLQCDHLMTYPVVRAAVEAGTLRLHPLMYDIRSADLFEYSPKSGRFELMSHNPLGGDADAAPTCHAACGHGEDE